VDCKTPKLHLPSEEDFGNFTANFTIGFIFDDYDEYEELDEERHNISVKMTFVELPSIDRHSWPAYDSSKGDALTLEVLHHSAHVSVIKYGCHFQISWGAFQNQAVVLVGGVPANIAQRFDNSLLFTPPDNNDVNMEKGCHESTDSFSVEVRWYSEG
jgi:hypothetical protein